jgi:hypothetical protein
VVKLNPNKTSSRRKMRKAHFGATSVERRKRMSAALNKDLFLKYHVGIYNSKLIHFFIIANNKNKNIIIIK